MKKILYLFWICIIINIFMIGCNNDPYIGKYKSSDNTILELSSNGNCTFINNLYKGAFYTEGKYVIKDNKIEITFGENEQNYCGVSSLKGKFEGSNIKFYKSSGEEKDYIKKA